MVAALPEELALIMHSDINVPNWWLFKSNVQAMNSVFGLSTSEVEAAHSCAHTYPAYCHQFAVTMTCDISGVIDSVDHGVNLSAAIQRAANGSLEIHIHSLFPFEEYYD